MVVVFLERLADLKGSTLPAKHLSLLARLYGLSTTTNSEIRLRFYLIVLAASDTECAQAWGKEAADWVVGIEKSSDIAGGAEHKGGSGAVGVKGRMKFCRPVFKAIAQADAEYAKAVWKGHRVYFHPIAIRLIDRVGNLVFASWRAVFADGLVLRFSLL